MRVLILISSTAKSVVFTITVFGNVKNRGHEYIHNTQKALVGFLFEFSLVKDLNHKDRVISDLNYKRLVPVGTQGLFNDGGGLGLFSIDSQHSKRVR